MTYFMKIYTTNHSHYHHLVPKTKLGPKVFLFQRAMIRIHNVLHSMNNLFLWQATVAYTQGDQERANKLIKEVLLSS